MKETDADRVLEEGLKERDDQIGKLERQLKD